VFQINFFLDDVETYHIREIYDLLGLLGDLGGIQDILIAIVGIFVFPYSEFSFNLKAMQKLYLVSTTDPNLIYNGALKKKNADKAKFAAKKIELPSELTGSNIAKEVEKH